MSASPTTPAEPSPIEAATQAFEHTRRNLFPFRFKTWLTLGLVAFLDQCGRGGMSGSFPGGQWRGPVVPGGASDDGDAGLHEIAAWLGAHVGLVVAGTAVVLTFIIALSALILWVNSRATFVYVEDVATGRAEIARPWSAHADAAWSYFGWRFAVAMGFFVALVVIVGSALAAVFTLRDNGYAIVVVLLVLVPLLIFIVVAASLLAVALRDFVAPIQMAAGVTCGEGLRVVAGLGRAHPVAIIGYQLWRDRLGGAPNVIGATVGLNGHPFTVIGVMPPEFKLPDYKKISVKLPDAFTM